MAPDQCLRSVSANTRRLTSRTAPGGCRRRVHYLGLHAAYLLVRPAPTPLPPCPAFPGPSVGEVPLTGSLSAPCRPAFRLCTCVSGLGPSSLVCA